MALPQAPSAPVDWLPLGYLAAGTQHVPLSRLRVYLAFASNSTAGRPRAEECWVDTGASLTVIPYRIHQRLSWQSLGLQTTWRGIPCTIGSIAVWLPVMNYSALRGPLTAIAKFPHYEPASDPNPILLGLEFFQSHPMLALSIQAPAPGSIVVF